MEESKQDIKTRKDRLKALFKDPDFLDRLCTHVSNGGTLITTASDYGVRFGDLSNWLRKDSERERRYIAALNDRSEWGAERFLQELRFIGLSDIRKVYAQDGALLPVSEWPEEVARAITSVETDELFDGFGKERELIGHTKKIRFTDKIKALELLGKNLKLFVDKIEHSGSIKLEDLVNASHADEKENNNQ